MRSRINPIGKNISIKPEGKVSNEINSIKVEDIKLISSESNSII